jgi:dTMP kinase
MPTSIFIAIEGLDGSGKTTASKLLTQSLQNAFPNRVKNSFEPHDASAGGLFLRQVLMKKITDFDPRVLALGFATNRLDHCKRVIEPWLNRNDHHILISDRYYLSSLVYQSSEDFGFDQVIALNEKAISPDLIFFMNVSNEVCYQRMAKRNQPQELFETKFSETRDKYRRAIDFLIKRGDNIVEIDASSTVESVVRQMLDALHRYAPNWDFDQVEILENTVLSDNSNEQLFLNYLTKMGYEVGKSLPAMPFDSFELEFNLPLGMAQKGCAIILNGNPRYDIVIELLQNASFYAISDFVIVFAENADALANSYHEREKVHFANEQIKLSPSLRFVGKQEIA